METPITAQTLANLSLSELQSALTHGTLTSRALVLIYLERIARFDKAGPSINAMLEINSAALQEADHLDRERQNRGPRGPLHGIPIVLKDNIATADTMHTSAGSLALQHAYAPHDAWVAERLRAAGAIILGKVNLTEWANFMTENMPNGYSSRGGQVLNPYGPGTFDTGGSSAGSGAAVASAFAAAAIGTETSGSILSPASSQALVGVKPTVGLISRFGIVPISHSQDTAGPMTRTVEDAAILLSALTGFDPRDPATGAATGRVPLDYTEFLNPNALHGSRIGIPRSVYYQHLEPWQQDLMERAIQDLAKAGAIIVDPAPIPTAEEDRDHSVLVYEFKSDLNAYLHWLGGEVTSLADVIAFNQSHSEEALKYGQTILLESEATSGTLTEPAYLEARRHDLESSGTHGIDAVMEELSLDALLFPANFGAGIAAKAGYPSITVPAGYSPDGQPLGATLTARAFEEPRLIALAFSYEKATENRRPPRLKE